MKPELMFSVVMFLGNQPLPLLPKIESPPPTAIKVEDVQRI